MIIIHDEVVQRNENELQKFVPGNISQQEAAVRRGSFVVVDPPDGVDSSQYLITFLAPFVVMVADPEPLARTLANIINTLLGSTSPTALINQVGKIESDLEEIAKHLKTKKDTGILEYKIPVHTKKTCKYSVKGLVKGKILIEDNSTEDKEELSTYVQWDGDSSLTTIQRIHGEANQDIRELKAHLDDEPGTGHDIAGQYFSGVVETDGGMFTSESTSVFVKSIEVAIIENCPDKEQTHLEKPEPKIPKKTQQPKGALEPEAKQKIEEK